MPQSHLVINNSSAQTFYGMRIDLIIINNNNVIIIKSMGMRHHIEIFRNCPLLLSSKLQQKNLYLQRKEEWRYFGHLNRYVNAPYELPILEKFIRECYPIFSCSDRS